MQDLTSIWQQVSTWPTEDRRVLAARLLESVAADEASSPGAVTRRTALQGLIGIWKTTEPPNDEQVDQIIEDERLRKYG